MYTQQIDLFRFSRPCTKFKWKTGESFELVTNITKQQVKVSSPKCFKRIQNAQRFFFCGCLCLLLNGRESSERKIPFLSELIHQHWALVPTFYPPTPSTFTNIKGQQQQQLKKGIISKGPPRHGTEYFAHLRERHLCVCVCVHIGNSNPRPGRH